jgi:hypothetical protein
METIMSDVDPPPLPAIDQGARRVDAMVRDRGLDVHPATANRAADVVLFAVVTEYS